MIRKSINTGLILFFIILLINLRDNNILQSIFFYGGISILTLYMINFVILFLIFFLIPLLSYLLVNRIYPEPARENLQNNIDYIKNLDKNYSIIQEFKNFFNELKEDFIIEDRKLHKLIIVVLSPLFFTSFIFSFIINYIYLYDNNLLKKK